MAYLTKVTIGGITIKDDSSGSDPNYLFNWEYEKNSGTQISELSMALSEGVNSLVTLVSGQSVEIWAGYTTSTDKKIFSGFISEFNPEAGKVVIMCKDKMWDLIRKNVNTVYEDSGPQAGQISAIAEDLIETYGGLTASITATGTAEGETVGEFRCDNTDIWERLVALAQSVNYSIWYDPSTDVVNFKPGGSTDSGQTLTVGDEIINIPKWVNDTSQMVNDLRVDGAMSNTQIRLPSGTGTGQIDTTSGFDTTGITLTKTPESVELIMDAVDPPTEVKIGGSKDGSSGNFYYVDKQNKKVIPATGSTFPVDDYAIVNYTWLAPSPIHKTTPESIELYGTWDKQVTIGDIRSIADAEARTAEILSKFSIPFLLGDFMVSNNSDPGIELGDKVIVVDTKNSPNINQQLVITKQVLKYPGTVQEIRVGDEALRLADWQFEVEIRLKRIEELLSLQNQDLILELRDFGNIMPLLPRYRWILKTDVDTSKLFWNHPTYGVWDTGIWSALSGTPEDYWIGQFEDTYSETFGDNDFEDPVTEATWGSGSLIFA